MGIRGYGGLLLVLLCVVSPTVIAQENRTNLELIESIKDISISPDIYSDIPNIKNLAILFLSFEDGDVRNVEYNKFADSVRKFLEEFNTIFVQSRNDLPAHQKESVRKAIDLKGEAIYLESLSRTSPKLNDPIVIEIVEKEKDSLDQFLEERAHYFEIEIEKEEAFPIRIEYQEYITLAYQGSGNTIKSELARTKLEEMTSNFNNNMDNASNFSRHADELKKTLDNEDERVFVLFSRYIISKDVVRNYSNAIEIYHDNGISDKTLPRLPQQYAEDYTELTSKEHDANELSASIFNTFFIKIVTIVIPLFLAMVIFMIGFRDWQRDFTDTKLNTLVRRE
ncbi:MAG: hypothetical protein M8353_00895 [ANME-2 cluster archaeon]|nr:hypothetical protein [ANME-2 cluster archaeon]